MVDKFDYGFLTVLVLSPWRVLELIRPVRAICSSCILPPSAVLTMLVNELGGLRNIAATSALQERCSPQPRGLTSHVQFSNTISSRI